MNEPKKYHTIPVVHQKNFADKDKYVHVYFKDKKEFKKILWEYQFQSYDLNGNLNNDFEKNLSKYIETSYENSLNKGLFFDIKRNKFLSKEQRDVLIDFAGVQYARTVNKRDLLETKSKEIISQILEKDELKPIREKTGLQEVLNDKMNRLMAANYTNNKRICELADRAIRMMSQQNISFLLAPEGSQFITSDEPTFITKNKNFVMPLSSEICMITGISGKNQTEVITMDLVSDVNCDIARNASELLVARDKHILEKIATHLSLK